MFDMLSVLPDEKKPAVRQMIADWAFADMSLDDPAARITEKLGQKLRPDEIEQLGDEGVPGAEIMLSKAIARDGVVGMLVALRTPKAKKALIDGMRYPVAGLPDAEAREIRRIKARVEAERLPRGADATLHMKLGRGGLADVEWLVQLLQLQHAGALPQLRELSTIAALAAASGAGLLTPAQHDTLRDSWLMATRIRNLQMLVTGKSQDQVSTDLVDLRLMSDVLGLSSGPALLEDYRRVTRRARVVFDQVFYGISEFEDPGI
jgi:hypothetical protein